MLLLIVDGVFGDGVVVEYGLIGDVFFKFYGGGEEVLWSVDGKMLYFVLCEVGWIELILINFDIFGVVVDGLSVLVNLMVVNKGMDNLLMVLFDGCMFVWFVMVCVGYEVDC